MLEDNGALFETDDTLFQAKLLMFDAKYPWRRFKFRFFAKSKNVNMILMSRTVQTFMESNKVMEKYFRTFCKIHLILKINNVSMLCKLKNELDKCLDLINLVGITTDSRSQTSLFILF